MGQFGTTHAGHTHISKQHLDLGGAFLKELRQDVQRWQRKAREKGYILPRISTEPPSLDRSRPIGRM